MSLKQKPQQEMPEATARLGNQILKTGDPYRIIGDLLPEIVKDEDFKDLYPLVGRTAISPALLAMVSCFQAMEHVSDRAAARLAVMRIDWKYALRLPLDYAGFDYSVLSEFRDRLIEHGATLRVFEKVLNKLREMGLVKGRLQRTDSLAIVGAVSKLNRLEMVMESVRVTLEAIARTNEKWLRENVPAQLMEPYIERAESGRLIKEHGDKGAEEVQRMATRTGCDGVCLLARIDQADTPKAVQELPEVATLRMVWTQQYEVKAAVTGLAPEGAAIVVWRKEVASAGKDTISTPHDAEARFSHKRDEGWQGYKAQVTETVQEDPTHPQAPQLITDIRATPATTADYQALEPIQQTLSDRDLLPETQLVDNGYVTGETLASSGARDVALIGPAKVDSSRQARSKTGAGIDDFEIDYALQQVRCPQGKISTKWHPGKHNQHDSIQVIFDTATCEVCPLYSVCVKRTGHGKQRRGRTIQIGSHHELIKQRRQQQITPDFKHTYRRRSGIEGSLSAMVRSHGLRLARMIGLAKVNLDCIFIAISVNLKRAARWLAGVRTKFRSRRGRLTAFVPAQP